MRPRVQRLNESGIGDVVAEGREAEFARPELDVRRADEAPRYIDDADCFERSCLFGNALENLECLQEVDRAYEKCRGARLGGSRVRLWGRRPDEGDIGADVSQRERSRKAGRPSPDHGGLASPLRA